MDEALDLCHCVRVEITPKWTFHSHVYRHKTPTGVFTKQPIMCTGLKDVERSEAETKVGGWNFCEMICARPGGYYLLGTRYK